MSETKGSLFVISAPSGAGKTSLVHALLENDDSIQVSVSHTTRDPRPGEVDGVDYHFVEPVIFERMIGEGDFLEHAHVFGNYYGTSHVWVKETLNKGIDVILEIDWQGAQQIRRLIDCTCIFILPPSLETLESRLHDRGKDKPEVIEKRMQAAKAEMSHYPEGDYIIINDDFDIALGELKAIITAKRCSTPMQQEKHASLLQALLR